VGEATCCARTSRPISFQTYYTITLIQVVSSTCLLRWVSMGWRSARGIPTRVLRTGAVCNRPSDYGRSPALWRDRTAKW